MTDHVEVRRGVYYDSVSLMQVSRKLIDVVGVSAAQVAMATELNLEVIAGMGFSIPDDVRPNDLLIAIRAESPDANPIAAGQAALEDALAALRAAGASTVQFGVAPAPRTLGGAIRLSGANLALVSVPGASAAVEAYDAIAAGASVMVFSDNVPVEDEIALKEAATARDVLVMGPDCGTALVNGVALGFANAVRRGQVGIVAASGTGAQQVMCLLDAAGVGVSHCLGVGGRDLSSAVAGRSTRQALKALAADPATTSVIVVSKPPADEVLAELQSVADDSGKSVGKRSGKPVGKPVHWATLGPGRPDLTAAVGAALAADGHAVPSWPSWINAETAASSGYLRGLFCGGTLADEAMLVASRTLGGIRSNIPLSPELALPHDLSADAHLVIDFGDDALTRGRAHPMIDPSLRLARIRQEGAEDACGVLLLDLVLGYGAHQDPVADLAAAITDAKLAARRRGRELPVVISLIGAKGDPQGLSACAAALHSAGTSVFLSNAEATRHAVSLLPHPAQGD